MDKNVQKKRVSQAAGLLLSWTLQPNDDVWRGGWSEREVNASYLLLLFPVIRLFPLSFNLNDSSLNADPSAAQDSSLEPGKRLTFSTGVSSLMETKRDSSACYRLQGGKLGLVQKDYGFSSESSGDF